MKIKVSQGNRRVEWGQVEQAIALPMPIESPISHHQSPPHYCLRAGRGDFTIVLQDRGAAFAGSRFH